MKIILQTLTPIWTGGVDQTSDRLHETGLIGSLRWWYEALVRGLDGYACDPTSDDPEQRCQFDVKAYGKTKNIEDGLKGVCSVCRLFGCTGWRRRFDLRASTTRSEPFWLATRDQQGKFNHWWLSQIYETEKSRLAFGELMLEFTWMRGYENQHEIMEALLSLISQLGSISPKPQYGFGLVYNEGSLSTIEGLSIVRKNIIEPEPKKILAGVYPSLRDYWLLQCTIPEQDAKSQFATSNVVGDMQTFQKYRGQLLPVSFDIRYKLPGSSDLGLRQSYRSKHGKMPTRQVFGTLHGNEEDKHASSVFVSHLYKKSKDEADYQLRVWGFTRTDMTSEIAASLKSIFPHISVEQKIIGAELLGREVSI
ncbi:MAG: type III-B CRISPR module RAMP protein Cmr1 [Anaerolineae bacterium UTCFX2]|jgi:CRISPR-associated protein Cmr1|nr:type III-B CRISPR module RAMP protein Cmr1 [Anaerolineae bacterium]MCZ7552443.1 type III-B CRISPR module RAMP protein Cmr1 [Anaerolineales bacterium]OQY95107.1 MAG: type III-B CRISPR module RAMP protein Cmr1 [Anaerolineae bacterium UTCFX2]